MESKVFDKLYRRNFNWIMRGIGGAVVVAALAFVWGAHLVRAQAQEDPVARAKALVAQMTLDEKIEQVHGVHNETQFRMVPGIPRLGIPDFHITNGPAGAGPGGAGTQVPATALPSPIALAASWDVNLAQRYGEIAGAEAKTPALARAEKAGPVTVRND